MRPESDKKASSKQRPAGRLAAEKKKIVAAVVLITLMVFMWVKMLTKGATPAGAQVAIAAEAAKMTEQSKSTKITFVDLCEIAGRHDVLKIDFFDSKGFNAFKKDGEGDNLIEIEEIGKGGNGKDAKILQLAKGLKLCAITPGDNPEAFINDELVSVGGKLFIEQSDEVYEFEVVAIEDDNVVVRCKTVTVIIKMSQSSELAN